MKFLILILFAFMSFTFGFLQYPFLANNFLEDYLSTIEPDQSFSLEGGIDGLKCNRECKANDRKVCRFHFVVKYFQTMGGICSNCTQGNATHCLQKNCVLADGVPRSFLSINFQIPGPSIHVCQGDIIVVDLTNMAEGVATAIHWHGIRQMRTQFMDGVPFVTQCPIPFGTKFRYAFHADDPGTHFYHAHAGHQKANGVQGALIIRAPVDLIPSKHLYDFDKPDHLIVAEDWMHRLAEDDYPGMTSRSVLTRSMLINGHGRYFNTTSDSYKFAPWSVFNVEANKRYRFRFINSGFNVCPFMLQIEDHNFTIIATEISYVRPLTIDSLYSLNGERFDFILNTDKPPRDYWIRVQTMMPCRTTIETFAILRYGDEFDMSDDVRVAFTSSLPPRLSNESFAGKIIFNSPIPKVKDISLLRLHAYDTDRSLLDKPADEKYFLFLDSPTILDETMSLNGNYYRLNFETSRTDFNSIGTFNNITLKFPSFPPLTQPESIDESDYCHENTTAGHHCFDNKFLIACQCIHRIKLNLNASVELVVVNVDDQIPHPIHLHGHKFHILDMGVFDAKPIPGLVRNEGIPNVSAKNPPYKDTVVLPYPGYVRLRFRANNPGFWLFHCHFDWHLTTGMAVIFQVGELDEISKVMKVPDNFPKCNNFKVNKIN